MKRFLDRPPVGFAKKDRIAAFTQNVNWFVVVNDGIDQPIKIGARKGCGGGLHTFYVHDSVRFCKVDFPFIRYSTTASQIRPNESTR